MRKRVAFLLLGLLCAKFAHARQEKPVGDTQQSPPSVSPVDPKTHDAAVKLVEAIGMKQRMKDNMDQFLADGVEKMKKQFPKIDPAFGDEWTRRMKARINFDDFVAIAVQVYEKYFTAAELDEMTQAQLAANQSKTPAYSDPLKDKLQRVMTSVMSEIVGGCTQLGAKLGGDVGTEIGKEHPEWAPAAGATDAPSQK